MKTECTPQAFGFHEVGGREIVARFDGGRVTSDGGGILLREVEERFGFVEKFAACFTDKRLIKILGKELNDAKQLSEQTGKAARVFKDFRYQTQKSWSCERRVVGKAEQLENKANPRFVVTSLSAEEFSAQATHEVEYCGRGNMENRIKEQQLFLFADRTSCQTLRANQLRLAFSTVSYVLLRALNSPPGGDPLW